jgi:hypothetical protein
MLSTVGRHSAVPITPAIAAANSNRWGTTASGSIGQIRLGHIVQPGSPCRGGIGPTGGGGGGGTPYQPGCIVVMSDPPLSMAPG